MGTGVFLPPWCESRGKCLCRRGRVVSVHGTHVKNRMCDPGREASQSPAPPLCLYCTTATYFPQNVMVSAVKCPLAAQSAAPQIVKTLQRFRPNLPLRTLCLSFEVLKPIGNSPSKGKLNVKVSWFESWIVYTYLCMYTNKSCALIKTILWTEMGKIKTFVLIHISQIKTIITGIY